MTNTNWLRAIFLGAIGGILFSGCMTAQAQSLEQFYAKQYTEGLGRIPDQPAWTALESDGASQGCTASFIGAVSAGVYNSDEFWNDYQINGQPDYGAMTVALYRGMLNREVDQGSLDATVSGLQGAPSPRSTWGTLISNIISSNEFQSVSALVCQNTQHGDGSYYWRPSAIASRTPTNPPGVTCQVASDADLRACITQNAGTTILLSPDLIIPITNGAIVIPPGTTLATFGYPQPTQYASMARLVREFIPGASNTWSDAVVNVQPGGSLQSVWVDGNRANLALAQNSGCANNTCGCQGNYCDNIHTLGGDPGAGSTVVRGVKSSDSDGESSIFALGQIGNSVACVGNPVVVANNLVTQYATSHIAWEGSNRYFSDGISVECGNTLVQNNSIIDATDVGIDLFGPMAGASGAQASQVYGNYILNAGNGAFGGIVAESREDASYQAYGCQAGQSQTSFVGALIGNNTLWTGANGHMGIAVSVGVRPWYPDALTGYGVTVSGNNSGSQTIFTTDGITLSGMCQASIHDNSFALNLQVYQDNTCIPDVIIFAPGYGEGSVIYNNSPTNNFDYREVSACIHDVPLP